VSRFGIGVRLLLSTPPLAALACLVVGACLPGGGPALIDGDDAGGGTSTDLSGDAGFQRSDVDLGDPFALYGLDPSHGPYSGRTSARLTGRGFTPKLRVFLGDQEVTVVAGDPTRAVIETPPGKPGWVDVKIRDDATAQERVLKKGFFYDSFGVEPTSGATSGGTRIKLTNAGTPWTLPVKVAIGGADCVDVEADAQKNVFCTTLPGSPGLKDVTVLEPNGTKTQAREAFAYSDSTDGYRGGLSGGAFNKRVRVLALDASTGMPIPGAYAIVGDHVSSRVQLTSASGVTEFNDLPGTSATVTVAAKCHQPITYVNVPVDTVTAYLSAVLDTDCLPPSLPDPPSTGGNGGKYGGVIEGELVFPGGSEFVRTGWTTVPAPQKPTERRAAYIFEASDFSNQAFQLPSIAEAITPDSEGSVGYKFSLVVYPGNVTFYIVAGLEDRSESPPRFLPYAMGVARGVSVPAQTRVTGVDVHMDILFDHTVTVAPQTLPPGARGPDRFATTFALTLGASRFAVLPRNLQVAALPAPATMPFTGVPSLDHAIAGEQYVLGGIAATGALLQQPASVVSRIKTTDANNQVPVGNFLAVPVLTDPTSVPKSEPNTGTWAGTRIQYTGPTGFNLQVVQLSSGNGLVTWTIAAPGGATAFDLPDLDAVANKPSDLRLGLIRGPIATTVRVGRIVPFDYGKMRQGQLAPGSWNAHAFDTISSVY
jgi:hypothetical protein